MTPEVMAGCVHGSLKMGFQAAAARPGRHGRHLRARPSCDRSSKRIATGPCAVLRGGMAGGEES